MQVIQSTKMQRQETVTYVGASENNVYNLVIGKNLAGVINNVQDVPVGAKVYSVDVSVNFISASSSDTGTYSWMIVKFRDGQTAGGQFATPDASNWSNIGLSSARNQIVKSFQGIFATEDAGAVRYNIHVKIPKIMQRTREGDSLVIVFNANGPGTLNIASRYKYYQ